MNRRKIQRRFSFNGLSLQLNAVKALESVLRAEDSPSEQLDLILGALKQRIEREGLSSLVDITAVEHVVAELSKNEEDRAQEAITVVDAFSVPLFRFSHTRKQFHEDTEADRRLHAGAPAKCDIFRNRLALLHQRLMRNPMFAPPVLGQAARTGSGGGRHRTSAPNYVQLTQLESLVGSSGRHCLFGLLTTIEEGQYYLEDLNSRIPLDLSRARTTTGLFTEGCIVLAEGVLEDGIFHVDMMGFPPPERRSLSLKASGALDFLGLPALSAREVEQQQALEDNSEDTMFVVLSDVHLDLESVQRRLRRLFKGFDALEEHAPPLIVLMGNFVSRPFGQGEGQCTAAELGELFEGLARTISQCTHLVERTHFLFVPGPDDPGAPNLLPRPAIPGVFARRLLETLPEGARATFTTNPCRVRFYTQEIVLFREDIVSKMRRHCVLQPNDTFGPNRPTAPASHDNGDGSGGAGAGGNENASSGVPMDSEMEETVEPAAAAAGQAAEQTKERAAAPRVQITEHLVKTVLDQGHLCPLPLSVRPLHWAYDSSLHVYPLPDMLVLADHYDQYQWTYEECGVFNPGSFPIDGTFVVYRPASRETASASHAQRSRSCPPNHVRVWRGV